MPKPKVFVTRLLPKVAMQRIEQSCEVEFWEKELPPPRKVLIEKVRGAEGLLSLLTDEVDAHLMDEAPHLKVVSNYAVGFDNVDVPEATKRGIMVTNTPGVLTETTADLAFALMMSASRRVPEGDRYVRAGRWKTWGPMLLLGQDVHDATLGIVGMGRIGAALARRAHGFGMEVLYYDIVRQKGVEEELNVAYVSFEKLLKDSDFISVHVNLTPETFHLFGEKEFRKMKNTCTFVNTARGPIVDNIALYHALRNNLIAGAGLDVTEPEPLPSDHPLLALESVVITPHIASASVATRTKMALMAAANLVDGVHGKVPTNLVNPEVQNAFRERKGH